MENVPGLVLVGFMVNYQNFNGFEYYQTVQFQEDLLLMAHFSARYTATLQEVLELFSPQYCFQIICNPVSICNYTKLALEA